MTKLIIDRTLNIISMKPKLTVLFLGEIVFSVHLHPVLSTAVHSTIHIDQSRILY